MHENIEFAKIGVKFDKFRSKGMYAEVKHSTTSTPSLFAHPPISSRHQVNGSINSHVLHLEGNQNMSPPVRGTRV